jgi:hypothetical protein
LSIDRSDDDAPTELDVDLSGSSSAEITLRVTGVKAPGAGPDTLPADTEPTTLEPQMTVRGLGGPPSTVRIEDAPTAPRHPADDPTYEGPPKSVEERLLKAYAAEVQQRAQDKKDAREGGKPRAPTLPTVITPSEPFRITSSSPVTVKTQEDEETFTDPHRAAIVLDLLAPIESADAVTEVSGAPRMLSSSDLITDPGITDPGVSDLVTDPGVTDPGVAPAAPFDEDDLDGKGGTVRIVVSSGAMRAAAAVNVPTPLPTPNADAATLPPSPPLHVAVPPPMETARRQKISQRRATIYAVLIAFAMLGVVVLFGRFIPRPVIPASPDLVPPPPPVESAAPTADPAADPSPSAAYELPSPPPSASATTEPREVPGAASVVDRPRTATPARPPWRPPPPRPTAKPAPPASASAKAWAPLHI